jgi:hypothetical protein
MNNSFIKLILIVLYIIIYTKQAPLNLNISVVKGLSRYEKKVVVCDKIAQFRANKDRGKFRDIVLDSFGEVLYKTKRIIYDRLIVNCIRNINDSYTETLIKSLINDEKIYVKKSPIEEILNIEKMYKTEPVNFDIARKNITYILDVLYHPSKFEPKVDKEKEKDDNEKNDYETYLNYSEKDIIIILIIIIIFLFIIIILLLMLDIRRQYQINSNRIEKNNKNVDKHRRNKNN